MNGLLRPEAKGSVRPADTAKTNLKPFAQSAPEGRVSGVILNPKGLRRSIGL